MLKNDPWLLPDGVEEVLPDEAMYLEQLRRRLLDAFAVWGYELVIPPLIDYLESLLTGSGHDLDLQTFKLTDQLSGKLLGIRADMTPQVARIDAHNLGRQWPTRLCYAGTILHTRGDPLEKTRTPMQIGAELYGHPGIESDLEVILLMLEMLAISGVLDVHLDLGHVGIYRSLCKLANLDSQQESALFEVLQRKAKAELGELIDGYQLPDNLKAVFLKLPELNGGRELLTKARQILPTDNRDINKALADLTYLADALHARFPSLPVSFDLAELRGYHYHTGVVFAAFVPSIGREIARGGRYDNIGKVFGRARPATGFSADLKLLSALTKSDRRNNEKPEKIFAPYDQDAALQEMVRDLRAQGRTVIQQLPGQSGNESELNCTSKIIKNDQGWIIAPL